MGFVVKVEHIQQIKKKYFLLIFLLNIFDYIHVGCLLNTMTI